MKKNIFTGLITAIMGLSMTGCNDHNPPVPDDADQEPETASVTESQKSDDTKKNNNQASNDGSDSTVTAVADNEGAESAGSEDKTSEDIEAQNEEVIVIQSGSEEKFIDLNE